jgi:hypothetical protein
MNQSLVDYFVFPQIVIISQEVIHPGLRLPVLVPLEICHILPNNFSGCSNSPLFPGDFTTTFWPNPYGKPSKHQRNQRWDYPELRRSVGSSGNGKPSFSIYVQQDYL